MIVNLSELKQKVPVIDKLSNILTNNGKLTALSALTLLILMILFSKSPVIDSSLSGYNIDNNPYDSIGQRMATLFGSKNMIQVLVKPEPGSTRNLFSGLNEAKKEIEGVFPGTRVESLAGARQLLQGREDEERPVKEMLTEALEIPVACNLVSRDTSLLLMVAFTDQTENLNVTRFDSIIGKKFQGIESMHAISQYHIQEAIEKAITRDYLVILPVVLFFIIGFLYFSYRSSSAVLFCMINLCFSFVPVLFFLSLFRVSINQISASALPIVVILSLSASVYLITGFIHRTQESDLNVRVFKTVSHFIVPSFLSSLTTAIAFGSFFLSNSHYIRQFGIVTACSIMVVFLQTYLVAPFTIRFVHSRENSFQKFKLTTTLEKWLLNGKREISLALLLVSVVSLFFVSEITFRTNLETYIPRGTDAYSNTRLMQEAFHSLAEIDILIEPVSNAGSDSTKNLKGNLISAVADLSEKIALYPETASVQSIKDQIEYEQRKVIFGIPTVRFSRHGNPFVSEDREKYRINVKLMNQEDISAVTAKLADDFKKYEPGFRYSIYSDFLFFEYISSSVTGSLLRSLLFSALLIFLTFFTLTVKIPAISASILANLVPLGFLVLIFAVFKIDMNITTSITLVICLGLIVDNAIQILYRRVRLAEPLEEISFGALTTSLILTGGFLSFVLSHSRPNQVFGLLCAIVFLIAVISDMTIMPWILKEK
jgi:hypothetical protein